MTVLAYLIPAFAAVLSGIGIFAFCNDIKGFHKYMGFTLIFEGLFMLLAGYIISRMNIFSSMVFILYYLMMLLSPFFYYFASRYFLKEAGVKEKDFWMLEAVVLFVVLFAVVAGRVEAGDRFRFFQIVSGQGAMSVRESAGVAVLLSLDDIAFILFMAEQLFVQIFCFVNLFRYKRLIETYYSNAEGKSSDKIAVVFVLVALRFVIFICANLVARPAGQMFFQIVQCAVFSVFYIVIAFFVCKIRYTAEELSRMISAQSVETIVDDQPAGDDVTAPVRHSHAFSSAVYEAIDSRLNRLVGEKFFLDPDIDLFTLSSKIQVNSKYVAEFLKAKYGETFLYFVNRLRVEYAISLMEKEGANLLDVAEQSGFISQSTFYRNFKKIKGIVPSEFRKNR